MHTRSPLAALCAAAVALAACSIDAVTFRQADDQPAEDCEAAGDEDGNGLADCGDPACAGAPSCPAVCGNGTLEAGEVCDDGNLVGGDGCDERCMAGLCGDGVRTLDEVCDDGNGTCGMCSADCQVVVGVAARGAIVLVSSDELLAFTSQTFTLFDGISDGGLDRPVTFELTTSGRLPSNPSFIPIQLAFGQSAMIVRSLVMDAINNLELRSPYVLHITATPDPFDGAAVELAHDRLGVVGNVPIFENVVAPGFLVHGMLGGSGGDCASGQRCEANEDCASNVCGTTAPKVCQ